VVDAKRRIRGYGHPKSAQDLHELVGRSVTGQVSDRRGAGVEQHLVAGTRNEDVNDLGT
jgi:hypothetical protein